MAAFAGREDIANQILLTVSPPTLRSLSRILKPVELKRGQHVQYANEPVRQLYFVNRGMVSLVKTLADGRTVEVSATGPEGLSAVEVLFGTETSAILDGIVQVPGSAFVISRDALKKLSDKNAAVRALLQDYLHLSMEKLAQNAACNRLHSLEERCCRWLLIAHDSALESEFPLTHEFLAMMLGVQRPGVTLAMRILQKAGFVRYVRGKVLVTDRLGLEGASCECYAALKAQQTKMFARHLAK